MNVSVVFDAISYIIRTFDDGVYERDLNVVRHNLQQKSSQEDIISSIDATLFNIRQRISDLDLKKDSFLRALSKTDFDKCVGEHAQKQLEKLKSSLTSSYQNTINNNPANIIDSLLQKARSLKTWAETTKVNYRIFIPDYSDVGLDKNEVLIKLTFPIKLIPSLDDLSKQANNWKNTFNNLNSLSGIDNAPKSKIVDIEESSLGLIVVGTIQGASGLLKIAESYYAIEEKKLNIEKLKRELDAYPDVKEKLIQRHETEVSEIKDNYFSDLDSHNQSPNKSGDLRKKFDESSDVIINHLQTGGEINVLKVSQDKDAQVFEYYQVCNEMLNKKKTQLNVIQKQKLLSPGNS